MKGIFIIRLKVARAVVDFYDDIRNIQEKNLKHGVNELRILGSYFAT